MRKLERWLRDSEIAQKSYDQSRIAQEDTPSVPCINCQSRVALWDALRQVFASAELQARVQSLQEQSAVVIDTVSRERALVGEVVSTVALAGQISREFSGPLYGVEYEIDFCDDNGVGTGQKVYLQLKPRRSYEAVSESGMTEV